MTPVGEIPVSAADGGSPRIDLIAVHTVLGTVAKSLARFLDSGAPAIIDLKAAPHMNPATYRYLKEALSAGEVTAKIAADATINIAETRYPGVWWLTHRNERGAIVTELIEIAEIPVILKSHAADMRAGLQRLEQALIEPSPQQSVEAIGSKTF